MDSDQDGKSNGEELGDPNCQWTQESGLSPDRITDITHPGVCDPFESANCKDKNSWVSCEGLELECDAIKSPDVQNFTVRFPETEVPAEETTYMCMIFDVPSDEDYHFIASKPVINNQNVMHHVIVYGCESDGDLPEKPYICGMGAGYNCNTGIGGWTVGSPGDCLNENFGVLFGKSRFKRFALEFHWNNPKKHAGTTDSSGMTFYYTSKLRPNNGGLFSTGQTILVIPPSQPEVTFTQECSGQCTNMLFESPMYVTSAINHMHYLGDQGYIEHIRNGQRLRYLTNEPSYSYDNPRYFNFDPPAEILPGDTIKTTCVFNSKYKSKYVYYGDGTSEEMCFGFFWYYPENATIAQGCVDDGNIHVCNGLMDVVQDGCDITGFIYQTETSAAVVFEDIAMNCNLRSQECTDDCMMAVKKVYEHPCFKSEDVRKHITRRFQYTMDGMKFLNTLGMCQMDPEFFQPPSGSAASTSLAFSLLVASIFKMIL